MAPSNKASPGLLILGGGVCGIYAGLEAKKADIPVQLFEKESSLGGLAAGHKRGENWFDLGVHMLHAFDQEVFETCADAMEQERIEVPLKAHIKWLGKQYHYPLRGRDILSGLPPHKLAYCIAGLVIAELTKTPVTPDEDAESALIDLYGEPLYRFFFEDFTHRYWGMHPQKLSAEFIRRKMPRLSAVDVFKNLLSWLKITNFKDTREGVLRFETLHYSKTGTETLVRRLAQQLREQGGEINSDSAIDQVFHEEALITGVETSGKRFGHADDLYTSTIPITEFIPRLNPLPPAEVLAAAKSLSYKPMVVYALLIKKERCMDALYTYYRDRIFHRVGEPKNAGLEVKPADYTTLIVEMTCEVGDEKWTGSHFEEVVADLESEGLCQKADIVEKHLIHSRYAYPIFKKGFETHLDIIQEYLSRFTNLRSTGRQGAFTYPNMHSAMRMGAEAVTDLLKNRA